MSGSPARAWQFHSFIGVNPLQTTWPKRGIVSGRVALLPRSAEIQPPFHRFSDWTSPKANHPTHLPYHPTPAPRRSTAPLLMPCWLLQSRPPLVLRNGSLSRLSSRPGRGPFCAGPTARPRAAPPARRRRPATPSVSSMHYVNGRCPPPGSGRSAPGAAHRRNGLPEAAPAGQTDARGALTPSPTGYSSGLDVQARAWHAAEGPYIGAAPADAPESVACATGAGWASTHQMAPLVLTLAALHVSIACAPVPPPPSCDRGTCGRRRTQRHCCWGAAASDGRRPRAASAKWAPYAAVMQVRHDPGRRGGHGDRIGDADSAADCPGGLGAVGRQR